MKKILGIWTAALALVIGFSLLGLSSCNVAESPDTYILRLHLDDSLAVESGLFKTIKLDLLDGSGNVTHEDIFNEPYDKKDSARLANLIVPPPIPNPATIKITAYKNTGDYWVFKVRVDKGIRKSFESNYVPSGPIIPNPQDTSALVVVPETLFVSQTTPRVLAVDGADVDLVWTVLPAGSDQRVEWTSSDTTVVQIIGGSKIRPLKKGPAKITGKSKAKSDITTTFDVKVIVPVKVDAITMNPKSLTLYTGGPEGKLIVTLTGDDSGAQFTLASSNDLIASVSAAGSVKGLAAGSAVLTAAVVGYPAVTSVCSVKVIKDPPVVTVSPNQSIAFNGEAVFTVSVASQAYGTTVEIKADMDGDNVYEQTVLNKETAEFRQKYTEVKTTTVSFKVKDTEGNEETVTRRVTVGAPGTPIVSMVNPSKDTAINVTTFKIRFTVKDTVLKIDTLVDSTLTLIVGSNKVRAARRNAGGEGSDEVIILVDNVAPVVTINGAATQTSGVAAFSLAGTAGDLSSGLQSVAITGALSGNGLATLTADSWSKGGLTLAEGVNTLVATALDKAGNTQTASITVNLDSKKPGAPVVTAPGAVRAGPIKWTWIKANGDGSGTFKVRINGGPEIDATLAEYSLATGLVEGTVYGLSVKETDPIAGDGPWSVEKKVLYDTKKPDPGISVTLSPTNDPTWTWSSNGGVGTYRWYYKTTPITYIGNNSPTTTYSPTLAAGTDATHTLCVQEKDSPEWGEEWGAEKCASIRVDKKGPDITGITYPDGYVTNQTSLTFSFTAEGPKTYTCQLGNEGENNCILTASDALGNTSTVTRKIWRRSNVVFVRVGGTGNGSSFDNAYGSLWQAIRSLPSNKNQIWMMEGDYNIIEVLPPHMRSGVSIYGGFSDAKNQSSEANRDLNSDITLINSRGTIEDGGSSLAILRIAIESGSTISDITLDGLRFQPGYYGLLIQEAENITIKNCVFSNPWSSWGLVNMENAEITFNDCRFEENTSSEMLKISGKTVVFERCNFKNNRTPSAAFHLSRGTAIVNNSTFQNTNGFVGMAPFRWITIDNEEPVPALYLYNCIIQGLGDEPGPIVSSSGVGWIFSGSGNRAP